MLSYSPQPREHRLAQSSNTNRCSADLYCRDQAFMDASSVECTTAAPVNDEAQELGKAGNMSPHREGVDSPMSHADPHPSDVACRSTSTSIFSGEIPVSSRSTGLGRAPRPHDESGVEDHAWGGCDADYVECPSESPRAPQVIRSTNDPSVLEARRVVTDTKGSKCSEAYRELSGESQGSGGALDQELEQRLNTAKNEQQDDSAEQQLKHQQGEV